MLVSVLLPTRTWLLESSPFTVVSSYDLRRSVALRSSNPCWWQQLIVTYVTEFDELNEPCGSVDNKAFYFFNFFFFFYITIGMFFDVTQLYHNENKFWYRLNVIEYSIYKKCEGMTVVKYIKVIRFLVTNGKVHIRIRILMDIILTCVRMSKTLRY